MNRLGVKRRLCCFRNGLWIFLLLFVSSLSLASDLYAAEAEHFMVRGGPIWLKADSATGSLQLDGATLHGASLSVDDVVQPGLLLTWLVNRNFSLETMVSTPLQVNLLGEGGLLGSQFRAAQVDVLPLMLIGRYSPDWDWCGLRPFAGIGGVYILFDNAKTTATFDALSASLGLNNPQINVDNKILPVLELGVDYLFGKNWFANASWVYLEGESEIAVNYSNGMQLSTNVSYAPQFFALTLGYRF